MISLQKLKYMALGAVLVATCTMTHNVMAQDSEDENGLIPSQATVSIDAQFSVDEETHPPLRLTPDRSEIIELDKSVNRVIIGNEVHINVMLDTAKRLIIVPRIPGATFFSVLDGEGNIIMQRHVVVANPKEKYVRVRQPCRGTDACMPIRMYYCPEMCHEIAIVGEDGTMFSGSITGAEEETTSPFTFELPTTDGGE